MSKTTMQELIDELNQTLIGKENNPYFSILKSVVYSAEKKLAFERSQLADSFYATCDVSNPKNFIEYYDKKYMSEK